MDIPDKHVGPDKDMDEKVDDGFALKKRIGFGTGVAIIAGTIVGSGIFVSPVGILQQTNNSVGLSLVMWLACGVISLICALCYAELGTSIKRSGGDYAYLDRIYGEPVAFMHIWSALLILRGSSIAAKAIVFGTYLVAPFFTGDCDPPTSAVKSAAAALIIACCGINYISVKFSAKFQIVFTIAKFIGMFTIIVGGLVHLGNQEPVAMENFNNAFRRDEIAMVTVSQIGLAFYQGLWAYEGFANLNFIVEEVKDVSKNLPRCIVVSLLIVTGFYLLVNVAYLSALTPNEMISSKSVAVTFGFRVLGSFAWLMPVTVCLSIIGSTNGSLLSEGRVSYVASRRGHWPQIIGMVHCDYYTPATSLMWDAGMGLVFLTLGDFDTLVGAFSFTTWLFRTLAFAGLIYLRWKEPNLNRPYKVNLAIVVLALIISVFLVIAPLISEPELFYLYAVAFILGSMLVYYPLIHRKIVVPGASVITKYIQMVLNVAPSDVKYD